MRLYAESAEQLRVSFQCLFHYNVTHVYVGNVDPNGGVSGGLEFKTGLGGWLFSACWVISM